MPLYECVVIGRSEITQQQVDTLTDTVVAQVEADGATVRKREYWGLRSLAYRIKKNRKGHYLLLGLDIEVPGAGLRGADARGALRQRPPPLRRPGGVPRA